MAGRKDHNIDFEEIGISASCAGCVQGRGTRPPDDNSLMLIDFDRV